MHQRKLSKYHKSTLFVIASSRIPAVLLTRLAKFAQVIPFDNPNIPNAYLSHHPDISMCLLNEELIITPDLPSSFYHTLDQCNIPFCLGKFPVNVDLTAYNAIMSDSYFIHKLKVTDPAIAQRVTIQKKISVPQGFTRCSTISLRDNSFITSDLGIFSILKQNTIDTRFVSPKSIILPGYAHGLLGGTCGICPPSKNIAGENNLNAKPTIFFLGSLCHHEFGDELSVLIQKNYNVIELYDIPLFDAGSLFFFETG